MPPARCATRLRCAWSRATRRRRDLTYAELARQTNRFANVLRGLGVGQGDRVFVLAGRIPELYVAALGALKNGSVVRPLFSAFGPEPIATRIELGDGAGAGDHRPRSTSGRSRPCARSCPTLQPRAAGRPRTAAPRTSPARSTWPR